MGWSGQDTFAGGTGIQTILKGTVRIREALTAPGR